jgi:hypothetical protein
MHEAAQIEIGVVLHVRRHLRVAEIALARAMRIRSQRAQKMCLSGARLAVEQQDAILHVIPAAGRNGGQQVVEFLARLGMDLRHIDGVGAPQIVFPGYRMLERLAQLVGRERVSERRLFEGSAFNTHFEPKMPSILDAHKVPDGILIEDLGILERFEIAAVFEISGR